MNKLKFDKNQILTLVGIGAVLILTMLVYFPGLPGPLLLDDFPQLEGLIAQGANNPAAVFNNHVISTSGPLGRPVAMASFIGSAITHGPDIWWWKYDNLMLHLISGLLVAWLTALLADALPRRGTANPWLIGVVVAGLWLLHPLHVSTVLYTVQRMTELSTLFVLAGLVCYVKGRLVQQESIIQGWAIIGLGFGAFFPLAVFSKESALLFPVYCSVVEFFVLQFRGQNSATRQIKILHGALVAGYISAAIYVVANFSSVVLESYAVRDFSILERILTQFRVIVIYLDQILLPVQSKMGFFHDDITLSSGLLNPISTLLSALVSISLITSAFLLRHKSPLYAFGIFLFFASHLLESSIFALEIMFEHRNYFGSLGILIAAVSIGALILENKNKAMVVVIAVCLSGFSFLTWQRSLTWSSPASLYDFAYYAHPESPRLNLTFSNVYASSGDFENSRQFLDKVGPGLGPAVHELFLDCRQFQRIDDSDIAKISQIRGGIVRAHATSSAQSLVAEVTSGRCRASSNSLLSLLDHLLGSHARSAAETRSLLTTKAAMLEAAGDNEAAAEALLAAHELSTDDAVYLYRAAGTLINSGRPDEAHAILTRAFELEKTTRIQRKEMAKILYIRVANAYSNRSQLEKSLSVYYEAASSMPGDAAVHVGTADLLLRMGRISAAEQLLQRLPEMELDNMHDHLYSVQRIEKSLRQRLLESSGS
ncbi:MAG: tetratricopeptide repeat protein [Woeseiales bacterium]